MKPLLLVITICLFLLGCEKDNPYHQEIGMVQIENSTIADTVMVNEIVSILIKASAGNGCWSNLFVNLEKEETFEYSLKAYGTYSCFEGGCACPDIMVYHDTIIDFYSNQKGTYLFRIHKNSNTINTDTLIVE